MLRLSKTFFQEHISVHQLIFISFSYFSPLPLFAATDTFFIECIGVSIAAFLYLLEDKDCECSILTMMSSSPYSVNSTPTYLLPQLGAHVNKGTLIIEVTQPGLCCPFLQLKDFNGFQLLSGKVYTW